MKIIGWSIDGFGVFNQAESRAVAPGLTVFHGPNEAGKSTLLAFLRGMLFGFPDRRHRNDNVYPPLRGGRHGGVLELEGREGRYRVERYLSPRRETRVRFPDGREAGEDELARVLGGVDAALYRSIFAFGLTELASFEALSAEGVRDRILSAEVAGAGRSASTALGRIRLAKVALLNRRHERNRGRIQELIRELHELDQKERGARADAAAYPACVETEARMAGEIERLQARARAMAAERTHYHTLVTLWPLWHDLENARRELATLPPLEPGTMAALDVLAKDVERATGRASELAVTRRDATLLQETLAAALQELGPGWDRERLARFDASLPRREDVRSWEERLDGAGRRADESRRKVEEAEGALNAIRERAKEAVRARSSLPDANALPGAETIQAREAALRRIRTRLQEYRARSASQEANLVSIREKERSLRSLEANQPWSPSGWAVAMPILFILGTLVFVLRAALDGGGQAPVVVVGSAVAFVLILGTWILVRLRIRGAARSRSQAEELHALHVEMDRANEARDTEDVQLLTLRTRIAEDAVVLGVSALPSFQEIEDRGERLATERAHVEALERSTRDLAALEKELARGEEVVGSARDARDSAERDLEKVREAWESWKSAAGAPATMSPRGVIDFFIVVEKARSAATGAARCTTVLGALETADSEWRARAHEVLAGTGQAGGSLSSAEDLARRVVALHAAAGRVRTLRAGVASYESTLDRQLGAGSGATELRQELSLGHLDDWREETDARDRALEAIEKDREEAIRNHDAARKRREGLERSADVASLQIEGEGVLTELASRADAWRVLSLAEALIEETRSRFTQARRPAVLAEASRLFAAVTGGRYTRVDPGEDEERLVVLDRLGVRRETSELSRGTAEQLYLCVRLGYAGDYARRSVALPLVMDDVLVNFDLERAHATARVLAEYARDHQVLFFTCHPHVRDAFRDAGAEVAFQDLTVEPSATRR